MEDTQNPFTARWSSEGHTLCLGHWDIHYKGVPLVLPKDKQNEDMDTYGNFSWLYPDDDEFVEGTPLEDWIEQNADWLLDVFKQHNIPTTPENITWFYLAVNTSDWRCSSCGGCL